MDNLYGRDILPANVSRGFRGRLSRTKQAAPARVAPLTVATAGTTANLPLHAYETELPDFTDELDGLRAALEATQADNAALRRELANACAQVTARDTALSEALKSVAFAREEAATAHQYTSQLSTERAQAAALEAQLKSAGELLAQARAEAAEFARERDAEHDAKKKAVAKFRTAEVTRADEASNTDSLRAQLSDLQVALADSIALREEAEELRSTQAQENEATLRLLEQAKQVALESGRRAASLEQRNAELVKGIDKNKATVAAQKRSIETLESGLVAAQSELAAARESRDTSAQRAGELLSAMRNVRPKSDPILESVVAAARQVCGLPDASAPEIARLLPGRVAALEARANAAEKQSEQTSKKLRAAEAKLKKLQTALDAAETAPITPQKAKRARKATPLESGAASPKPRNGTLLELLRKATQDATLSA